MKGRARKSTCCWPRLAPSALQDPWCSRHTLTPHHTLISRRTRYLRFYCTTHTTSRSFLRHHTLTHEHAPPPRPPDCVCIQICKRACASMHASIHTHTLSLSRSFFVCLSPSPCLSLPQPDLHLHTRTRKNQNTLSILPTHTLSDEGSNAHPSSDSIRFIKSATSSMLTCTLRTDAVASCFLGFAERVCLHNCGQIDLGAAAIGRLQRCRHLGMWRPLRPFGSRVSWGVMHRSHGFFGKEGRIGANKTSDERRPSQAQDLVDPTGTIFDDE